MMTDIAIAREAAVKAQANDTVAAMIRSGKHDDWPNVQGALNAIRAVRAA
jgi:thiazole synthase ThiGH ThiG subunit